MSYIFSQIDTIHQNELSPILLKQITPILSSFRSNFYRQIIKVSVLESVFALGISWKNPIHPHAEYLKIYIDDSVREVDMIQNQLLAQLEKNFLPSSDRFIYSLMSDQVNTISSLESNGYRLIRKTYEPVLTVEDCFTNILEPSHSIVLTYEEALSNPRLKVELLGLLKRNYKNTHQVNPVADMTQVEWSSLLLDGHPDLELSLVGLTNGSVSSYITVFPSDQTTVEIAWVGLSEETPISYLELKQLFKKQLELFKERDITSIQTEIDTTDYYALELFSFLNISVQESFNAYRKMI